MNKMATATRSGTSSGQGFRRLLAAGAILGMAVTMCACSSASNQKVRRVEVPVPYWEPPSGIQPLPTPPPLRSKGIAPAEAEIEVREALRLVAEDLRACLEDDALIRHLYESLVALCTQEPAALPTPGPDPP
jgi:hypothetical protein